MNRPLLMRRIALLPVLLLSFILVYAQKTPQQLEETKKKILSDPNVKAVQFSTERQTPSLIVLQEKNGYSKDQAKAILSNYLALKPGVDVLMPTKQTKLDQHIEVAEFQQYYKNIKVDHAAFKAFIKDGAVQFFNGAWYDIPATIATQPAINESQALSQARAKVGAKKYAWEVVQEKIAKTNNVQVKEALQKELAEYTPKGELVIVKDFNKKGVAEPRLAYKFNIYAAEPLSRAWIYIDAKDGRTLLIDKIIKHMDNTGNPVPASINTTVQTRYAGSQVIKTKQISGNDPNLGLPLTSSHPLTEPAYIAGAPTYVLIDDSRGGGIETYDLNGVGGLPISVPGLYTQGKSFTDVDNNWSLGEHHRSPANDGAMEAENDDIAWDAHWGAEVVYDYWLAKHNRLSYDGNNAPIKSFIHYGPAYDNAFWNGSVMTYGDGSGPAAGGFRALTSLDVCGHEIGHGVCSYTADLVYESESGAMNEALSDIWAACIEHFAMTRTGSTVPARAYRPFYIGEQIGSDTDFDHPLRRMDNPKQQGNPDTYGGVNWVNPDCTPNLVNDECGVHTNSGVLNKWFFLLTAGSRSGTRPAGLAIDPYYFADSDDETNDKGSAYMVNGLGFDVSENITFLMESMLSATATYAEARAVSIQVATALSGSPCSPMAESVTNAWYAVGVGEKFVKPCATTYGFIYKNGSAVSEASTPAGCASQKTVSIPVILPANATATITASGTATKGVDYTLSTTSLSNTSATASKQSFNVVILNDGVIEGDETIALKLSITNTGTNPVNNAYTLTITDDDVTPIIGNTQKVLLNETFTRADGFGDPAGWAETLEIKETFGDPAATGKNQWGIFGNQLAITGKEGTTDTKLLNGTYNSNSESQTIIKSPLLDARGLSVLNVAFDYTVQGETDPTSINIANPDIENLPVFDYMAVAYSLDGVHFTELNTDGFMPFASTTPKSGSFAANLPASLANQRFYLAFRWSNDANAGGPISVSIDNLVVKGSPRKIESDLNHNGRENLKAGQEVYFYSIQDGQVLGKIRNASTKDFGCTNMYVEKAGVNTFNLYQSNTSLYKVADKVVRIETGLISKSATTVTLYFTEEQLKNLETATGKSRTAFSVYQVDAPAYTGASTATTKAYTATYTPLTGVGGYYTISFTDKANGSYALGTVVSSKLLTTMAAKSAGEEDGVRQWKFESIYPNPGNGEAAVTVTAPKHQTVQLTVVNTAGQVLYRQSVTVLPGRNHIALPLNGLTTGSYRVYFRDETGKVLNTQQYIKR